MKKMNLNVYEQQSKVVESIQRNYLENKRKSRKGAYLKGVVSPKLLVKKERHRLEPLQIAGKVQDNFTLLPIGQIQTPSSNCQTRRAVFNRDSHQPKENIHFSLVQTFSPTISQCTSRKSITSQHTQGLNRLDLRSLNPPLKFFSNRKTKL